MDKIVRLEKRTPFSSLLVANRGEIALRIMETARDEGLKTIAVYTDADVDAPHVKFADKAVRIGVGPVGESYLSIEKILSAAQESGAEAVHPGYGFLSERADFASACHDAGLVFIGPSAEAIELMGNKAAAKRKMLAAKVPCVPGYEGEDQSPETLKAKADEIGYPVMIKAVAGGGGRGMRLVQQEQEFLNNLELARSEALSAFGSGDVILEKAINRPRHVEVQVFADRKGNTIHLGERDCSVQRRHQKIIEESPCPVLTENQRAKMGSAAVAAAKAIGYEGAGTVEFLLDENGKFYFLEMNTRLQVEHPVTEMVTDLDLVELQLAVAAGEPLGLRQDDIEFEGHAIEVRLYAEDPANDFMPGTGRVIKLDLFEDEDIRIDCGVSEGQEISPYYDPMLAKVIAVGEDREEALATLITSLEDMALYGPPTNRDFLLQILRQPVFQQGRATTAFVEETFGDAGIETPATSSRDVALAAAFFMDEAMAEALHNAVLVADELIGWGSSGHLTSLLKLSDGKQVFSLRINFRDIRELQVQIDDETYTVDFDWLESCVDGEKAGLRNFAMDGDRLFLGFSQRTVSLSRYVEGLNETHDGATHILAPMHGMILELNVAEGDAVNAGQRLAVVEAMKMQHELVSSIDGRVDKIFTVIGDQVKAASLLIELKED